MILLLLIINVLLSTTCMSHRLQMEAPTTSYPAVEPPTPSTTPCTRCDSASSVLALAGWRTPAQLASMMEEDSVKVLVEKLSVLCDYTSSSLEKMPVKGKLGSLVGLGGMFAILTSRSVRTVEQLHDYNYYDMRSTLIYFLVDKFKMSSKELELMSDVELIHTACLRLGDDCETYQEKVEEVLVILSSRNQTAARLYYQLMEQFYKKVDLDKRVLDDCIEREMVKEEAVRTGRHFDKFFEDVDNWWNGNEVYDDRDDCYNGRYPWCDYCSRGSTCCRRWCRRDHLDYHERGHRCTSPRYCKRWKTSPYCRRCNWCDCQYYYGTDSNWTGWNDGDFLH